MLSFLLHRLIGIIPLLIGITLITFLLIQLSPGGPIELMTDMSAKVSPDSREKLKKLYGLDKPIHKQYLSWFLKLVRLDFGRSIKDDRPVIKKIAERLPATLLLNVLALVLIFLIAIPIGVYSAVKQDTTFDKGMTIFVFIGFSMPTFWLALLLMILFGIKLGWLPISGLRSINYDYLPFLVKVLDISRHLILPVIVTAFTGLASISRYTRNNMLEIIRQDYILTARAKGLSERVVIFKHALRNALLPIVTILGLSIPGLISGSVIFEVIFAYPGMGRLGYDAVMARDYPVVMAVLTISAFLTLIGNLVADICYAYVDPRIRYK